MPAFRLELQKTSAVIPILPALNCSLAHEYAKLTTPTRWLRRRTTERSRSDTHNYLTFLSTSETFTP